MKSKDHHNKFTIYVFKIFIKKYLLQSLEKKGRKEEKKKNSVTNSVLIYLYCWYFFLLSLILYLHRGSYYEALKQLNGKIVMIFFFTLVFRHHVFNLAQEILFASYLFLNSLRSVLTQKCSSPSSSLSKVFMSSFNRKYCNIPTNCVVYSYFMIMKSTYHGNKY